MCPFLKSPFYKWEVFETEDPVVSRHLKKRWNLTNDKTFKIFSKVETSDHFHLASVLHPHADEVFIWCQDPSKLRTLRPQFWLILEITETEVQIFFQYREGQFEALLPWRQTLQLISNEVRNLCKKVNQRLLLNDLYENKSCNRLLEPETSDDEVTTGTTERGCTGCMCTPSFWEKDSKSPLKSLLIDTAGIQ